VFFSESLLAVGSHRAASRLPPSSSVGESLFFFLKRRDSFRVMGTFSLPLHYRSLVLYPFLLSLSSLSERLYHPDAAVCGLLSCTPCIVFSEETHTQELFFLSLCCPLLLFPSTCFVFTHLSKLCEEFFFLSLFFFFSYALHNKTRSAPPTRPPSFSPSPWLLFLCVLSSPVSRMKQQRPSGGSRRATTGGTDGRSLESALVASSLLLWLPYSLAAICVAYCSSFITEVPASLPGSMAVNFSECQGFGAVTSATSSASSFSSADGVVVTSCAVVGGKAVPAAAAVRKPHRYSSFYYYVFPADFDIAVFAPLLLRVLSFSVLAVAVTFYLAVYRYNGGEYLMAVAWALGTCSDYGWLTSSAGPVQTAHVPGNSAAPLLVSATPPSWLWLAVSLLTGFFSGILCKVKDIVDGKHDRDTHLFPLFDRSHNSGAEGRGKLAIRQGSGPDSGFVDDNSDIGGGGGSVSGSASAGSRRRQRLALTLSSHHLVSLGDRLYMVVPFCTGQWFSFILHHGWRGIVVENGTILLSLSLVGYAMLSYKFLKRQVLRASGRVTRSVAARGRSRRNQRRLREQQEEQQEKQYGAAQGPSGEDFSTSSTPSAEGAARIVSKESSSMDSSNTGGTPKAAAALPLSDEDVEEETADFFEDVGEVAFIDVIDLISKLFTTSFGVVVLCVVGLNIFMTSLCIPFLKALFKLNALVSGVGIVIELIMYEVA
jgi:uncharacterized membrane protein YgcG